MGSRRLCSAAETVAYIDLEQTAVALRVTLPSNSYDRTLDSPVVDPVFSGKNDWQDELTILSDASERDVPLDRADVIAARRAARVSTVPTAKGPVNRPLNCVTAARYSRLACLSGRALSRSLLSDFLRAS